MVMILPNSDALGELKEVHELVFLDALNRVISHMSEQLLDVFPLFNPLDEFFEFGIIDPTSALRISLPEMRAKSIVGMIDVKAFAQALNGNNIQSLIVGPSPLDLS